ncbi:hypothetical protein [Clostridium kluyveri]|nr:hypothetical protein [Clostridium kluyveri]UZQ50668.1 hypothetical protein OP486_00390 [Clostridium kluyveri]
MIKSELALLEVESVTATPIKPSTTADAILPLPNELYKSASHLF